MPCPDTCTCRGKGTGVYEQFCCAHNHRMFHSFTTVGYKSRNVHSGEDWDEYSLQNCAVSKTGYKVQGHQDPDISGDLERERGCSGEKTAWRLSSPRDGTEQIKVSCTCQSAFSSASQECLKINKCIRTHSNPATSTFTSAFEQLPHQKKINFGIRDMQPWYMVNDGSLTYHFFHWNHTAHNMGIILFNSTGAT